MRIAVLVNRYPSVTHSFIRREIQGLELAGIEVLRVAIARDPDPLVDPADREEERRTRRVLAHGVAGLLAGLAAVALTRPRACARAAALAFALSREGDRGLLRHLAYLAEACVLLRWCEAAAIEHVHAHFGTNACAVAALLRALGGPPFSFVVHGPEEFERPLGLERKRACAAFVVAASEHCRARAGAAHAGRERDADPCRALRRRGRVPRCSARARRPLRRSSSASVGSSSARDTRCCSRRSRGSRARALRSG